MHSTRHGFLSQLVCESGFKMWFSGWPLFVRIKGHLYFTCLLLCVFDLLDMCVIDFSSSNAPPGDTPPAKNPLF